jgi:hypothetical protein
MTRALLAGTAAFALLSGCAHSPSAETAAPPATAAQAPSHAEMMSVCPMHDPGTEVSVSDAVNGETLTFTTRALVGTPVGELRDRVRAMAKMHNQRHAAAAAGEGTMGGGMTEGTGSGGAAEGGTMGDMMIPPSHATVAELTNGASMTLTPNAPADLEKLQAAVRMHAQHMQQNGCRMMGQAHGS